MNKDVLYVVFFVSIVLFYINYIWQERKRIFLYRFFATRDKLYRYAITGKINERSLSFVMLSEMINTTIAFSKKFKLTNYIKYLSEEKLNSPAENIAFMNDLQKQDEEILILTQEFINNFLDLMIMNQPALFVALKVRFAWRVFVSVLPVLEDEIKVYQSFEDVGKKIAFAA